MASRIWIGRIGTVVVGSILLACNWPAAGAENGMVSGGYQRHRAPLFSTGLPPSHLFGDRAEATRHVGSWPGSGRIQSQGGSWFQRPYPYHLDYYRWRYQGSYAPYFGNLYGPPTYIVPPAVVTPPMDEYGYGMGNGGAWHW
ncbi:MAG: hypothetical protein JW829_02680 [Pirellulales bacterium]|nr:hypothetical protein [Pirellulales bacterium]